MNDVHKFWVVTKQVYKKNVRSGSWIFLVLSPILMGLVMLGISYFMSQSMADSQLAVVTPNQAMTTAIKRNMTADYQVKGYPDKAAAAAALRNEKADAVLEVSAGAEGLKAQLTNRLGSAASVDASDVQGVLNQLNMQLTAQRLKLSATQLAALLAPVKVSTKTVAFEDGKKVDRKDTSALANRGIAFGITILMMVFMMVYGSILAQEIATEKGSRIMEMLLSSVSATTQFFGKLCGILLLLLTQIGVYAVSIAVSWELLKRQDIVKGFVSQFDFSALASWSGMSIVAFFFLGSLTYAVLAAVLGSLVANQEQVQQAVMPLSMIGMLGYFLAIIAQSGDSLLIKITSYVPFLNVSVMPIRATMGYTKGVEVPLALLESLIFLILFTVLAVRIYRSNVLIYHEGGLKKALAATMTMMRAQRKVK